MKAEDALSALAIRCRSEFANELADALLHAGAGAVQQGPTAQSPDEMSVLTVYPGELSTSQITTLVHNWARARQVRIAVEPFVLTDDWTREWTQYLLPVRVHQNLTVVPIPPGQQTPPAGLPGKQRELYLEAGLAFGYGEHPTTRMISEWMALNAVNARVLDFGTGSGILALIALCSGAVFSCGVDIDEAALVLARRNARLNGFSEQCKFLSSPLSSFSADFEVVVANVDALTLEYSASDLCRLLAPSGHVALTGLLAEQRAPVIQAFAAAGVQLSEQDSDSDWVLLHGHKFS